MRTSASRQDQGDDQPFRTVATWLAIWAVLLFLLNI
jgi:hypothetical protein